MNVCSRRKAVSGKTGEGPPRIVRARGKEITTAHNSSRSKPARYGAALLVIGAVSPSFGCGKPANTPAANKPASKPASDEPPVLARPTALNDAGLVVGGIHAPDSRLPAFLYDSAKDAVGKYTNGKDTDSANETTLTTLPLPPAASWALPQGLNAQAQIVGFAGRADNGTRHAVVWQNGVCRWLDDQNAQHSEASGINANGDAVGFALDAAGAYHALKWRVPFSSNPSSSNPSSSVPEELLSLSRINARPVAINNQGEVAGWTRAAQNVPRLVLFRNGATRDLGL